MNNKGFIRSSSLAAMISGAVFVYCVYALDPRSGVVTIAIFLASLFVFIASGISLLLFVVSNKFRNNESSMYTRASSIRRGVLLGLYTLVALSLSTLQLLTWWDAILLAFSLLLFELYFMSGKERTS